MFTTLENISDQLYPYMQEVASITDKISREYRLSTDQAIQIAKVSAYEMIADCLFHIDEKLKYLDEISTSICCSSTRDDVKEISDSIDDIKDTVDYIAELSESRERNRKGEQNETK